MIDGKQRLFTVENFLLLLGFETTLFQIYHLTGITQPGSIFRPTLFDLAVWLGSCSLAVFFVWQAYLSHKRPSILHIFGQIVAKIVHNTAWLLIFCLGVFTPVLTLLIPSDNQGPILIQLIVKNSAVLVFISLIGMEILIYSLSIRSPRVSLVLRTLGHLDFSSCYLGFIHPFSGGQDHFANPDCQGIANAG